VPAHAGGLSGGEGGVAKGQAAHPGDGLEERVT
jgi:hypothetical protein